MRPPVRRMFRFLVYGKSGGCVATSGARVVVAYSVADGESYADGDTADGAGGMPQTGDSRFCGEPVVRFVGIVCAVGV